MIKVFSTYSDDHIYIDGRFALRRERGPAFYIDKAFRESKADYRLYTGKKMNVKISLKKEGESGQIVDRKIKSAFINADPGDDILVSTIGNEWLFEEDPASSRIFLDIQGYVRVYGKNDPFFEKGFWSRIDCLKGTKAEIGRLPKALLEKQKGKMLLYTRGRKGFIIFHQGKEYEFQGKALDVPDTIGAGDTFFANFVVAYVNAGNIEKAAEMSLARTENFLSNKQYE